MAKSMTQTENRIGQTQGEGDLASKQPVEDIVCYLRDYAREKPDVAALWCFGIGFVLGWKLKPW